MIFHHYRTGYLCIHWGKIYAALRTLMSVFWYISWNNVRICDTTLLQTVYIWSDGNVFELTNENQLFILTLTYTAPTTNKHTQVMMIEYVCLTEEDLSLVFFSWRFWNLKWPYNPWLYYWPCAPVWHCKKRHDWLKQMKTKSVSFSWEFEIGFIKMKLKRALKEPTRLTVTLNFQLFTWCHSDASQFCYFPVCINVDFKRRGVFLQSCKRQACVESVHEFFYCNASVCLWTGKWKNLTRFLLTEYTLISYLVQSI